MTYGKFLNRFSLLALFAGFVIPATVHAQNAGYSPPPMFEDMTPPMVRPEGQGGYIVTPKSSSAPDIAPAPRPAILAPQTSAQPPAAPVVPVTPSAPVAPATPPKMMAPIVEETSAPRRKAPAKPVAEEARTAPVASPVPAKKPTAPAKSVVVDTPAPIPPPPSVAITPAVEAPTQAPEAVTTAAPKEEKPYVSAITGPKTMPSLPVHSVDGQVTFEGEQKPSEPTILERLNQKEATPVKTAAEEKTLKPILPPSPKEGVAPAAFETGPQDVLKKSIVLQPGQISMVPEDSDPIVAGVIKELEGNASWRVQVKAYATPFGTGLSSDRRIALGRALSLRTAMIEQGVTPNRIDIMAEGMQTDDSKPGDRVDIYLYGPKTP